MIKLKLKIKRDITMHWTYRLANAASVASTGRYVILIKIK